MDICIDFDGTCVSHEFPKVGKDIGAVPVLKKLLKNGHRLILYTMRSNISKVKTIDNNICDKPDNYLTDAVMWFCENKIELYGINKNPTQHGWTNSPKVYGQLYIDDSGLGIPLTYNSEISLKPYVNWKIVEKMLINKGLIK